MEGLWPVIVVVVIVVIGGIFASIQASRRREALRAWAMKAGWQFSADRLSPDAYDDFDPFGVGSGRRMYNVLRGSRGGIAWEVFDYRYTTGSGKNRRTHHWGIAAAVLPIRFGQMRIRPEGWFDKLKSLAGFEDLNFELETFSRRYHVSSADRNFAYDVIHPQMIEYLLQVPTVDWQFHDRRLVLARRGRFDVQDLDGVIAMVEGFVGRLPEYVREDRGAQRSQGRGDHRG